MAAIPSDSFTFEIGNINFQVERQNTEMYPGIEAEMIVIEFEIDESEAGVCPII
jgi:hypothetical protein